MPHCSLVTVMRRAREAVLWRTVGIEFDDVTLRWAVLPQTSIIVFIVNTRLILDLE